MGASDKSKADLDWSKALPLLIGALIIDALGMLDKAFPMIDVVWAPLSSALLKKMFNSNTGAALQLFEESVPGFDWVPTATITWAAWTYSCWMAEKKAANKAAKAK
mmetsp:Transcript_11971/g.36848  ORF Transcript_11971/g.36848 Transcript_11971/m.36848 type:complete len:106 (-) Transcript_11971:37-354(-)